LAQKGIQEQLLEETGPLTSLWVETLRPDVNIRKEQVVQQIQRTLVLVDSTFHSINVEKEERSHGLGLTQS